MGIEKLEKAIAEQIIHLKPSVAPVPDAVPFQELMLDGSEGDHACWLALLEERLKAAKRFEIHCWNEEQELIGLALRYGTLKEDDWRYGRIITGAVTSEFAEMLLNLPKPADTDIYNKMTPFFQIFLDEDFQSCHYGTENYYR